MSRFLLSLVCGVHAALGLLLPLPPGEAAVVAKTLAQTPVTGRLANGGTFHGRLTLQALRFDEAGALVATGVLSGTAVPAAGRPTKVPARPFTTPVALLDLRGTCRTLVVDLAPLTVAPLVQELTLVPVVLAPEAAPKAERVLQQALCTVARLQEQHAPDSTGLSGNSYVFDLLNLSRLNHRLPGGKAHPEVVQGTAELHHEIAHTLLPQADPVFDDATALDTAVHMLDP